LALLAFLRDDGATGLKLPMIGRGAAFEVVNVGQRVSLSKIAAVTGLPIVELKRLNSALKHHVTPPTGPHLIYMPQKFGNAFVGRLGDSFADENVTSVNSHTVVAGDNLSSLAVQYGVSQGRLMKINALESSTIRVGQTLMIRESAFHDVKILNHYIVNNGDTLSAIAERFSVSIADIRDEQGQALLSDIIHPGERLSLVSSDRGRL
jgi:membrane-bound lytic murein transglycosylase D